MGQRVGANATQFSKIKRMLADGVPLMSISKTFNIEPQSLENIIAHIEEREPKILSLEDDPNVQALRDANEDLLARLAKYEDVDDGDEAEEEEEDEEAA